MPQLPHDSDAPLAQRRRRQDRVQRVSKSVISEIRSLLTAVYAFSHQLRPIVSLPWLLCARRLTNSLTSYKLHGSSRPISMKSDVIRKRARHDARRVGNGPSETPSASPGASRRASPVAEATPTLAPDSSTTSTSMYNGENLEYRPSMQSELMGALGDGNGSFGGNSNYFSYSSFPGPYNPDYLAQSQNLPADALPFASGDLSDADNESRTSKRRRMSNDSASEPPSSAVSLSSYADSFTSASSSASHSQRSSVDWPYDPYGGYGFNNRNNSMWHPPMLPPGENNNNNNSPMFIHPPMLPPDSSPNVFLPSHGMQHDDDSLFATYLHPPMLPPDGSPALGGLQLHPPMIPTEWGKSSGHDSFYDTPMVTF